MRIIVNYIHICKDVYMFFHTVATFVLFISYGIYMTLISFNGNLLEISVRVKKICAITVIVAVVISLFLFLCILFCEVFYHTATCDSLSETSSMHLCLFC